MAAGERTAVQTEQRVVVEDEEDERLQTVERVRSDPTQLVPHQTQLRHVRQLREHPVCDVRYPVAVENEARQTAVPNRRDDHLDRVVYDRQV